MSFSKFKEVEKIFKGPLGGGLIGIILLLGLWFIIDSFFNFFKNLIYFQIRTLLFKKNS